MNLKEELSEIKQKLATERDELRVKAHLFSAEVGEEWEDIEKKWDKFEFKASRVAKSGKEGVSDVLDATKSLGHEISEAYKRVRSSL